MIDISLCKHRTELNTLFAGNTDMVAKLAESAKISGKNNITFVCYMLLGKLEECLELLIETDRIPEAAFFARYTLSFPYPFLTYVLGNQDFILRSFPERIYRAKCPELWDCGASRC